MFRLSSYDANYILQQLPIQKYEKLILFVDFDNMLFGIYQPEVYVDFIMFVNRIVQAIEQVLVKSIAIYEILNAQIPTRLIYFASIGKENIRKYCDDYKRNRPKLKIQPVSEIVRFITNNTHTDDVIKGTRQLLIAVIRNIINLSVKDQVFLLGYNIESDIIPYIILNAYYNPRYLFVILSADKDFIQLLTKKNIILLRILYQQSNNIFIDKAKTYQKVTYDSIIENVKPFKNSYLNILYHALTGDATDGIRGLLRYYGLQRKQLLELTRFEDKINSIQDYTLLPLPNKLLQDLNTPITEKTINCKLGIPIHANLFQVSFELQKQFLINTTAITDLMQQIKLLDKYTDYKAYANSIVKEIFGLNLF